ncbi:unnamed protein product [Heterobilharzia americana]|nr:unnamed protein product [Heterobilharzia americana]
MASSLFKSRPEHLPPPKLYGYRSISQEEEKKLIERLSKPTISVLQAQLSTLTNQSQNETFNTAVSKYDIENITSNLFDYTGQISVNNSVDTETLSPSSVSSSRLVDLRSIGDYEKVAERLNKLAEIWNRSGKNNHLLPPCACARGEVLLREDSENWNYSHCHCYSTYPSVRYRNTVQEPAKWNVVNKIVRRLHSAGTAGSNARQKESQQLLEMLTRRRIGNSVDCLVESSQKLMRRFSSPEIRSSLFDNKGNFKPKKFINQWENFQVNNHRLSRISRPTTSSQLKRRGVCVLCDDKPSARTPLGVVNTYSTEEMLYHKTTCLRNKKQESKLVERVLRPTFASQGDKSRCVKSYQFDPHPTMSLKSNLSNIQLSGESIIQRLHNFNKRLPLISGLERSSSINSIICRLYSGKCRRSNCSNKQTQENE